MAFLDEIQFRVYRSHVKIPLIFLVPAMLLLSIYTLGYMYVNSPVFWETVEERLHETMGGHFEIGYARFDWSLMGVQVHEAYLKTPEKEEVAYIKHLEARITPLMLVSRRLEFEEGRVNGGRLTLSVNEAGELNLLRVFGVYDREKRAREDRMAVGFSDIELRDIDFEYGNRSFEFEIPAIDIPKGSVFIEPATVLMAVETLEIPRADFRFQPELFRFKPERGDWRFTIRDFALRNWQWANQGFTVEHFGGDVDGIWVEASGRMAFPGREAPSPILYDAEATVESIYESPLLEYFTRGKVRFDLGPTTFAFRGDMNEISGEGEAHARLVNGNGILLEDLRGPVRMENRFILTDEITGQFYGGDLVARNGYFNIRTTSYGADLYVEGMNPRDFVFDMVGQDQPFLDGRLGGAVRMIGEVPKGPEPGMGAGYRLQRAQMARYFDMVVLEELDWRRFNDELFPNQELRLTEGSKFYLDQRRLGLGRATVLSQGDRVEISDFYMDYRDQRFDFPGGAGPVRLDGYLSEIAPYATYFNLDGLEGSGRLTMWMEGYFGSPEWRLEASMAEPSWRVSEMEVIDGDELELELVGKDGEIAIERAYVDGDFGRIEARGRVGWFEPPPDPGAPQPWPVWEFRTVQPVELDLQAERLAMEVVSGFVSPALQARGPLNGILKLGGAMGALTGSFDGDLRGGSVREQPVEYLKARGELVEGGVRVEEGFADLGEAGELSVEGYYGYDGAFEVELLGEGIELAEVRELSRMPMQLGGRTDFHLSGEGTREAPRFSGGGNARNISVDGRVYGDVAIVADTVGDILYVSGGLLPWLTASIELPLKGDAPYYARLGVEELDVMAFLPELREHPMLDEVQATGMAELFFERDFSRYQAIFYFTELEIESVGQAISNRGPVVIGYNNGEVLTFQRATFGSRERYFTLEGGIAFDPMLMDVRVEGDFDLALLESVRAGFPDLFPDFFVGAEGYLLADMNVRGPPENFLAEGIVTLGPSEWEMRFLPEPVTIRSGELILGDHGIRILPEAPIEGTLIGGATRVVGDIGYLAEQPRFLDLEMWSHNMSYRIPELANLAFDTDLRLEASDWADFKTWLISGEMDILDGLYQQRIQIVEAALTGRVLGAFQRGTDRYEAGLFETLPLLNDIRFDMWVRARDGFRLQSQVERLEMDLEFRFDLLLQDTLAQPRVTGDIDVIGGEVGFQGEAFEVRSGTVRFTEDVSNPYLDILAGADVRNTCQESDFLGEDLSSTTTLSSNMDATGMDYYHILMNVRGELDNLNLEMESNPYADQRDILSLLLTGCTVDQLTASSVSRPTLEVALGPLLGRLEREIQDVVAVEEFTIMPGVERTQLRIGDTVTRRLSWRFQLDTGFADATGGQQYQLEYKLSDHWAAELSERSHTETNNFLIDLKLKYRLPLD